MLEAVLFDLDGTIAHSDPVHYATWRDILKNYDLEIDLALYEAHFSGRLNAAIIQDLLPHLSPAQGETLAQYKEAEFRQRAIQDLKPMTGFLDLLAAVEVRSLKRAVVTNAPVENAHFMLKTLGLAERLPIVILGEALERGKPDPLPYQVALERLGVDAASTIAFEDSPSGVRSAVGAGIKTVGIASTQPPEVLYGLGATLVIADFTDPQLTALLKTDAMEH
ncbi:MAG: HAD-IA family hydrolase [Leptolyngbyaceae cyanobacterium bins.59]|nr:HAD-IA family hydrolase [Leptolyngbyaceae cyanobacterium bins.59]